MEEIVYHTNFKLENSYWWFVARNEILFNLIKKTSDIPKDSYILDVGCGTGGFAAKLNERYNTICLDTSELALSYCKKRGLPLCYNMYIQDFPKNKYNIKTLTMLDVVEHVEDDNALLKEAYDLLEPDSLLVVTVPAFMFLWSNHDVIHKHYRRYTKKQLNKLLTDNNFQIEYSTYFNFFLFFPALIKRLLDKITGNDRKETEPVEKVSNWLNSIFTKIFKAEEKFINKKIKFPFGVSILTIAKKI